MQYINKQVGILSIIKTEKGPTIIDLLNLNWVI